MVAELFFNQVDKNVDLYVLHVLFFREFRRPIVKLCIQKCHFLVIMDTDVFFNPQPQLYSELSSEFFNQQYSL